MALNLGSTGLSLGSGLIIQLGSGTAITAPGLTWDSGPGDDTPEFTISFDATALEGDITILQWATNPSFTAGLDETPTVLDAADITAGFINEIVGPLAQDVYYFRAMITRGGSASNWSSTVIVTIGEPSTASLNFTLPSNSMYVPVLRFSITGLLTAGALVLGGFLGV